MAEHYFKVTVSTTVGSEQSSLIGPYEDDDLDEYGYPKDNSEFEDTVWEIINAGLKPISKEDAKEQGLAWW